MNAKVTNIAVTMAAALLVCGTVASGGVVNGGFEDSPDFIGWGTLGDTSVQGSEFGVSPAEGLNQAVLNTRYNRPEDPQPSKMQIERFLALPICSLNDIYNYVIDPHGYPPVTEGAAIRQAVTASAGDVIKFKWNFITEENQHPTHTTPDFGFVSLVRMDPREVVVLERLADPTWPSLTPVPGLELDPPLPPVMPAAETGYLDYSMVIPADGDYLLGFGVVDALDTVVPSVLLVDAVVPEPATLAVLAIGATVVLRRRRG